MAEQRVWHNLLKASEMMERANLELTDLAKATYLLHEAGRRRHEARTIARYYTNWLSDCSIVGVRINAAFDAAKCKPAAVSQWWAFLAAQPIHRCSRTSDTAPSRRSRRSPSARSSPWATAARWTTGRFTRSASR